MSLLHNWKITYDTSMFRGTPWNTTFLKYRDKHIDILITYSEIVVESLDTRRESRVPCLFHESNHFPMYYRSRSRIFQKRVLGNVVDK